jgi:hypothetical protein
VGGPPDDTFVEDELPRAIAATTALVITAAKSGAASREVNFVRIENPLSGLE